MCECGYGCGFRRVCVSVGVGVLGCVLVCM